MAPILYSTNLSPPVRAVLLTARALDLELELKEVDLLNRDHIKSEFVQINPQHTIPVLDDNGFIIWDSHAIASYLVGKYGKNDTLYPKDLQKRAVVDQRLHFDSGILFTRLRAIFAPILFHGYKEISKENEENYQEAYRFMDAFLNGHNWFAGDQMTIADFCAVATISSIVGVIPFDSAKYPKLSAWFNRMKALPYYQEVNGEGAENLSSKVNEALGRN